MKLVRNQIPEIIEQDGSSCRHHTADLLELKTMLYEKMHEELSEFIELPSLEEAADMYEKSKFYKPFLKGRKLEILSHTFLDSIRKNLRVKLMSEYYDSNKKFTIPTSAKDIEYLKDYNITISDFGNGSLRAIDSIYNHFQYPAKIFSVNLFGLNSLSIDEQQNKYVHSTIINCALPKKDCWSILGENDFVNVKNQLVNDIREYINKNQSVGKVVKIKDEIISVKLTNIQIKEDMILSAHTIYDFKYGNGAEIGQIDCQDGIDYYESLVNCDNDLLIEDLQNISKSFHVYANDTVGTAILSASPFNYKLQVIDIIDSVAITKRIKIKKPFVKVRVGDNVIVD